MSTGQFPVSGTLMPDPNYHPPRTEAELRQLVARLADPEEMARWLEKISNLETLDNRVEQQGRLKDL